MQHHARGGRSTTSDASRRTSKVKWQEGEKLNGVAVVELLSSSEEDEPEEPQTSKSTLLLSDRKRKQGAIKLAPVFTQNKLKRLRLDEGSVTQSSQSEPQVPDETPQQPAIRFPPSYYLRNFTLILDIVLQNNSHLFEEQETSLLQKFKRELSEDAQRLYIRLFQRKGPWFRTHSFNYPEIRIESALTELQHHNFCHGLRRLKNEDITEELLRTLNSAQLRSISRAAAGAYSRFNSFLGGKKKASSNRDELIAEIQAFAQNKSVQRTLDGRGMVATLVEKAVMQAPKRTPRTYNSESVYSQEGSQNTEDSEENYSQEDLFLSQGSQSQSSKRIETVTASALPYCVVRLSPETVFLFKRVHRLFFMKEGVDMTLLLLIDLEHVRYPEYVCRPFLLTNNESHETEKEKEKVSHSTLNTDCRMPRLIAGDESFFTPPASPLRLNDTSTFENNVSRSDTFSSDCNRSVFASRNDLLAYENAVALESSLDNLLEQGNRSPASGAVSSRFDFSAVEDTVFKTSLWLLHNAAMPSKDPMIMIAKQQRNETTVAAEDETATNTKKRKLSWSSIAEGNAKPSLAEEYHRMISIYLNGKAPEGEKKNAKEEEEEEEEEEGGGEDSFLEEERMKVKKEKAEQQCSLAGYDGFTLFDDSEERLESSMFCINGDSIRFAYRLGGIPDMFEKIDNNRRRKSEEMFDMVNRRPFLARFTDGWIFTRMVYHSILSFERRKRHSDACVLLRILLSTPYCPGKRGYWWIRLAINLEHMGRKNDALLVAECALEDPFVRCGDLLLLQKKVINLSRPPRRWAKPNFVLPKAAPVVTIEATLLTSQVGKKSLFLDFDGTSTCSVEGLALSFYCRTTGTNTTSNVVTTACEDKNTENDSEDEEEEGEEESETKTEKEDPKGLWGWQGTHCENGIFKTLFGLLMWDVIFADVDGVFMTPFQDSPLDLTTDAFYVSRKDLIEQRLEEIRTGPVEDLVEAAWVHEGVQCHGVSWRYNKETMKTIGRCIGGPVLAHVCKLFAEDYDSWNSGLPDLLLWKPEEGVAKVVEVKGPRDRLSGIQQAWLDQLLFAGMDAEVLRVKEKKTVQPRNGREDESQENTQGGNEEEEEEEEI